MRRSRRQLHHEVRVEWRQVVVGQLSEQHLLLLELLVMVELVEIDWHGAVVQTGRDNLLLKK